MKNNKSGFSLVELMVVVSIIAILASIAIPNFSRMGARAKQTAARVELSGLYTAEQAFFAEYSTYHVNLPYIGYIPDGIPVAAGCPGFGAAITNTRYYSVGFGADATTAPLVGGNPIGAPAVNAACNALGPSVSYYQSTIPASQLPAATALVTANTTFSAMATGRISGSAAADDVWTIDNNKSLANTAPNL